MMRMTQADTCSLSESQQHSVRSKAAGRVDQLARRGVHARLKHLTDGAISIHDTDGTELFGDPEHDMQAQLRVFNPVFYRRAAFGGGLGFAESYLDGDWETDDLTSLLRVFVRNVSLAHEQDRGLSRLVLPMRRFGSFLKRNTRIGSRRNIAAHYDLGNNFFKLWLDDTMTYSSGIFRSPNASLRDASVEKLDRICRKLNLGPDDHVLETGTGWGSFALHAATNYGCRITTTTISQRQHEIAKERIEAAGLADRVTLLLKDYRDLEGQYDKLVSIEMIEAVGHRYLDTYLGQCSRLLKPDGQMLLQVISMPDQRYKAYLRTADFIQKHVFPGSCCPSLGAISASLTRATDMRSVHYEDMSPHYARTLRCWFERFNEAIEEVRALGYPERFIRLWNYYLCYCEAGFAERYIGVGQMLLNKPKCRAPSVLPEIPLQTGIHPAIEEIKVSRRPVRGMSV